MDYEANIACFARVARTFCEWCESPVPPETDSEGLAFEALSVLSAVYAAAFGLPDTECPEAPDAERPTDEQRKALQPKLARLPVRYYWSFFVPSQLEAEEPVVGDLADDYTDIYCDLREGLWLYDRGHVQAAVWNWRFTFGIHWGHHATDAMYALQAHESST